MLLLTQMIGKEVLAQKLDNPNDKDIPSGWNACVSHLDKVEVVVDRDKLAKILYEYETLTLQNVDVPWETIMSKKIWYSRADALISHQHEWLELKKLNNP